MRLIKKTFPRTDVGICDNGRRNQALSGACLFPVLGRRWRPSTVIVFAGDRMSVLRD
jgi:hypothetical protein